MATINNDDNISKNNPNGDPDGGHEGTHDSVPNSAQKSAAPETTAPEGTAPESATHSARDKYEYHGLGGSAKKVYSRLDNFWYYNKWKAIIAAFLIIVIGVCTYQILTREKGDIFVLYAGPDYVGDNSQPNIKSAIHSLGASYADYNGDGKIVVDFAVITYLTDEQIDEAKEKNNSFIIDLQANSENLKKFNMEIFAGESIICMLDPGLYARVRDAGGLLPLTKVFSKEEIDTLPVYDDYSIKLSETKFAKYYSDVGDLPDDTLLCVRAKSTASLFTGREKSEKRHEINLKVFRDISLFECPEGYDPSKQTHDVSDTVNTADTAEAGQ